MPLIQNLAIALAILSVPIAAYLYCYSESVFVFDPFIDTRLPQGFSVEQFEQIKLGMTKQQVLRLVPEPPSIYQSVWHYGNDGAAPFGDFAWFGFEVEFDQTDHVVRATRHTFYD
jgi:hypothetical protein